MKLELPERPKDNARKPRRKILGSIFTTLLILGVLVWLVHTSFVPAPKTVERGNGAAPAMDRQFSSAPSTDGHDVTEPLKQGALDLAMKTISLSQGEGGFELWRLKAEWASLHKQADTIVVEQPRLTYFMKDEGKQLFVRSVRGDVNQKTQLLRFIDNVLVSQDEKHLTSELLVYNGNDKTMTLPQGGAFSDTGIEGKADFLVWRIDRKRIEAEGDIIVRFATALPDALEDAPSPERPDESNI